MPKVELVYFFGCPNVPRAREMIRAQTDEEILEISQSELTLTHPYKCLSSPSVLVDGKLIFGAATSGEGCTFLRWEELQQGLRERL